jgi:hypothetical protein
LLPAKAEESYSTIQANPCMPGHSLALPVTIVSDAFTTHQQDGERKYLRPEHDLLRLGE